MSLGILTQDLSRNVKGSFKKNPLDIFVDIYLGIRPDTPMVIPLGAFP